MTKFQRWDLPIVAALCTLIGLLCGYKTWGGHDHEASSSDAATPDDGQGVHLPEATIQNLGIRTAPLHKTTFYRQVSVAAVVAGTPKTEQPVFAPIGGRIERIEVEPGTTVAPRSVVVTLVRDPLPRPQLTLTADVLRPAQEQVHQSVLELRKSGEEVRIARTELERVEEFTGNVDGRDLPIIPRQRAIDLRYQLSRAQKDYERARLELEKHGLDDAQIREIEDGAPLPEFNEQTWQRALARNGLWPAEAQELSAALPKSLRALPWVTATVGELAASGLATPELTQWVSSEEVGHRFLEIGVLLQRGHTLADLERLYSLNALEPVVRVVAPELESEASWDVVDVLTKRGAKVEAGDRLLTLSDPRRLFLRSQPVGSEVQALLHAAQKHLPLAAQPLIRNSGPALQGLEVSYVQSSRDNQGTTAFIEVRNEILTAVERENGRDSRTWALREGMPYLLKVPVEKLDDVYVLKASAIAQSGPDRVVFLQDGDAFKPVPVVVAYRDEEVVVIPSGRGVALFEGDVIVEEGAFELGLALQGSDRVDPHAGHNH